MPELLTIATARLLSLVSWLGDNNGASISQICTHFGRSRRQVLRDIEYLGTVGDSLPGASFEIDWDLFEREKRVHIRTTIGADVPPRFTADEAVAIAVGLQALAPYLDESLQERLPRIALAVQSMQDDSVIPSDSVVALDPHLAYPVTLQNHPQTTQTDTVKVLIAPGARWIIEDWVLPHTQHDDGTLTVEFPSTDTQWLKGVLLDIAPHILQIPPEYADVIAAYAASIVEMYSSTVESE